MTGRPHFTCLHACVVPVARVLPFHPLFFFLLIFLKLKRFGHVTFMGKNPLKYNSKGHLLCVHSHATNVFMIYITCQLLPQGSVFST